MNDRIKLAEAMGWHKNPDSGSWTYRDNFPNVKYAHYEHELPDPFTDANDDYAVLEWMRETAKEYLQTDGSGPDPAWKMARLLDVSQNQYHIGDYARAALKVIDNE